MEISQEELLNSRESIIGIFDAKRNLEHWAAVHLADLWDGKFQSNYWYFLLWIPQKGSTNSELAKVSGQSQASVSKMVQQLSQMGFVKSQISKFDRRSYTIQLTAKGLEMVNKSLERFSSTVHLSEVKSR
jgi:DNA-binding MarR family transcriptional regulator